MQLGCRFELELQQLPGQREAFARAVSGQRDLVLRQRTHPPLRPKWHVGRDVE